MLTKTWSATIFRLLVFGLGFCSCKKDDDQPLATTPNPAREEMNIAYGSHALQKMDVYFPEGYDASTRVVFVIHGGGFIAGTKEEFTMQARAFRDEGFITINLSHRLVDTAGLFSLPPTRMNSTVKVSDELADVHTAVEKYKALAVEWGTSTTKMYMAGHSAGAILSLLYTQGTFNDDGHIRAGANWAGITDLSIPHDSLLDDLDSRYLELLWRASGHQPKTANNLAYMAISPYWQANNNSGNPTISIWPENNAIFNTPGEVDYGLHNTRNFHVLLRNRGVAEKLSIYDDADHGFGTPAGSWERLIKETAAFFRDH